MVGKTATNPARGAAVALLIVVVVLLAGLETTVAAAPTVDGGDTRIVGSVVDPTGAPVDAVKIDLFEREGSGRRGAFVGSTTTKSGAFRFDGVDPGCHVLVFIAADGTGFGGSRYRNRTACAPAGGEVEVTTVLGPVGKDRPVLRLSVTDDEGRPATGASVFLRRIADSGLAAGTRLIAASTDGDGKLDLQVWPGCFILKLAERSRPSSAPAELTKWICVESGERADLDLQLQAPEAITISGRVVGNGDAAVPEVKIDLFDSSVGRRGLFIESTETGQDGSYRFRVTSGCYFLTFIAPPGFLFGDSRWYQPEVCVSGAPGQAGVDAVLASDQVNPAVVNAAVADERGPIAGAKMTLWSSLPDGRRGMFQGSFFTAPDGFISEELEPGCYWFIFVAPTGRSFAGSPFQEHDACLAARDVIEIRALLDPAGI